MRADPRGGHTSTVRSRRLEIAPATFGDLLSQRVLPRGMAGNGKIMTEKKTKANYTQSKERTTNGESGERTAARASAGTKRAGEREKAPAKAAAQKPRRAGLNRPPGAGKPAGSRQPAKTVHSRSAKRGLARLKEEARNMVEKDGRGFLRGLKEKARNGSRNDIKLLVDLAGLMEQKPAADPDDESRMELIQDLVTQPEYQEPAEDAGSGGSPKHANFQTASESAEKPIGTTNNIA